MRYLCVSAICPSKSAFSLSEPVTANLAVIAAIFVGVILTITIIVAAAIGYFGINCNGSQEKDIRKNGMSYKMGTIPGNRGMGGLSPNQMGIL